MTMPKSEHREKPLPLILLAILMIGGGIGYLVCSNQPQADKKILKFSGRIEGYETDIGVKRSGRIELINVREGAAVKKGQKLIKLDDSQ
jgi:HlyD family secretion protein